MNVNEAAMEVPMKPKTGDTMQGYPKTERILFAIEKMKSWNGGFTREEMASVPDPVFSYLAHHGIIERFGTEFYLNKQRVAECGYT